MNEPGNDAPRISDGWAWMLPDPGAPEVLTPNRSLRRVALLASLVVLAVGLALFLLAPWFGGTVTTGTSSAETWSDDRMDKWLGESRSAYWLILGLKGSALLLGIVFLVRVVLRGEKERHGLLPPPDRRGPIVPTSLAGAAALALALPLLIQVLAGLLFPGAAMAKPQDIYFGIAATTASLLPTCAVVLLLRRARSAGRVPPVAPALAEGFRFFCIASLIVLPVGLLWTWALLSRGVTPQIQNVVQPFVAPSSPLQPWIVGIFGCLVAPFTEECVFRGLLYPALRARVRGGAFVAAVIVSLLFAGIHGNLLAFLPLFVLALVLSWLMERTGSLLACVTLHALHNASSIVPLLVRHAQGDLS